MAETKKQFENKVSVTGTLKSLEVVDLVTAKKVPMKIATLRVETGKGETHTAKMMAVKHFERDGVKTDNKSYTAIETMQKEYVSIEDIAENKVEEGTEATVVNINGSMSINMYKNKAEKVVEANQIEARFVNRVKDVENAQFGAEFTLQTYLISKGQRVIKNEEETDEVTFKAATIDYRGQAHPFEFTANDEYGVAEWIEDEVELGQSLILQGLIINKFIVEQVERSSSAGIGKAIVDTRREVERKLLVEGIIPIEDEDDPKYITEEEIKEANKKYEDKKTEVEASTNGTKKTEVKKGVATSKPKAAKPTIEIDDDDLPF